MALIKCPECSSDVSDKATDCPKCGHTSQDRDESIRRLLTATVRVESKGSSGKIGRGTGFIVGNGRFAVTAFHVVDGAQEVRTVRYHQPRGSPLPHPEEIAVDSWTKGACLVGVKKDAAEPIPNDGSLLAKIPKSGTELLWRIDISILHLEAPFNNT